MHHGASRVFDELIASLVGRKPDVLSPGIARIRGSGHTTTAVHDDEQTPPCSTAVRLSYIVPLNKIYIYIYFMLYIFLPCNINAMFTGRMTEVFQV